MKVVIDGFQEWSKFLPPCIIVRHIKYISDHINKSIFKDEAEEITQDISFEEVKQGAKRSPQKSSPGLDGLPYEILNIVINHPRCKEIIEKV